MKLWRRKHETREAIYPIHGRSLGYASTPREPFTMFACEVCGGTMLGSPYESPGRMCFPTQGTDGAWVTHESMWAPMDRDGALAVLFAIESDDVVRQTQT